MVDSAQSRTKVFLDDKLTAANLTKDNGTDLLSFITAFDDPPYPVTLVFNTKAVDLIYSVGPHTSESVPDWDGVTKGYEEVVPVTIQCIDKSGITGVTALWKGEAELRRILETFGALINYRALDSSQPGTKRVGATLVWTQECRIHYSRDTA